MTVATVRLLMGDIPQVAQYETTGDGVHAEFVMPERPLMPTTTKVWLDGTLLVPETEFTTQDKVGLLVLTAVPLADVRIVVSYQWAQFADEDLAALLVLEGGKDKLAAADALDAIASSTALLQGRITMLDLTLDGPALAKVLQDSAKSLRKQVADAEAVVAIEGDFDWAEMVFPSNQQEALYNRRLRGEF